MLNCVIANIVHLIILCFVILVPFTNDNALLFLYIISIPNLLLHWVFKSNACSVTLIEKFVASRIIENYDEDNHCLSCKIIDPIYEIPTTYEKQMAFIYFVIIFLWLYAVHKLYQKYKAGNTGLWQLVTYQK